MESPRHSEWVYFKIYLGEAYDRCDGVILSLLPDIFLLEGIERLFFIRYVDDRGFHLRLRFLAPSQLIPLLASKTRRICEKTLERLPLLPPSEYFPMVPPTGGATAEVSKTRVGILTDTYEPELEKFGGQQGMPIAEALFEASSRIVLDVLRLEVRGLLSRKTIAPCFMHRVAEAFNFNQSKAEFWQDYSFYWLGGRTPAARDFRERFLAKAWQLHTQQVPVVAAPETLPEEARGMVRRWSDCVHNAAKAYARLRDLGPVTMDVLAFNFSHLMNNRLGLPALDEAYLGALLEQACEVHAA